jgi:hypothetical protein
MKKALEGTLPRAEVADLLGFLRAGRRTGVLAFERRDQETRVFLHDGAPVYANSTRPDLRFGSLLVHKARLKPEDVEQAMTLQRGNSMRLGQILISRALVTEQELLALLKVQISEVIYDTFTWPEGLFSFWEGVLPPPNAVTLDAEVHNLLLEALRRAREARKGPPPAIDKNLAVDAVLNPDWVKRHLTLTPGEWKVFFLADGRRRVSEICRLTGNADEAATLQHVEILVRARLVALTLPPPEPPAPPPAARPAPEHRSSIEFAPAARLASVKDDTRNLVTPEAVQYLDKVRRTTAARLTVIVEGKEASYPLTGDAYTLGRHRNNDIVISDAKVSSFHARIDRSPEGYVLVDLNSRNGSFVNGKRVATAVLKAGDELRLGAARLLYGVDYVSDVS